MIEHEIEIESWLKSHRMNKQEIEDWLYLRGVKNYTINDDLTVDVDENVNLSHCYFVFLPFQFGIIKGDFLIYRNLLMSLIHCPKVVHGVFFCHNNKLTSLEHCPKVVHGGFWCDEPLKKDPRYLRWLLAYKLKDL